MQGNDQPRDPSAVPPASLLRIVGAALLVSTLWLVFVGTTAAHELEVGIVAAALTTAFGAVIRRNCAPTARYRLREIVEGWRVPGYLLSDIAAITVILFKDILHLSPAQTLYRVSPYKPGATADLDLSRRVLVTALTTATPSIIVIGIDAEQRRLLFHQLQRSDLPKMTRNLGAHP